MYEENMSFLPKHEDKNEQNLGALWTSKMVRFHLILPKQTCENLPRGYPSVVEEETRRKLKWK
ncbi:hypothetical protein HanIR_Chr01g0045781 [Helianthus annuus]|nr:hypothetical protein HanIR_Chr01g0045781 [Helianthus annuus]